MLLIDKLEMLNNWHTILSIYFYCDFKRNVKITYKLIKNYMKK